MSEVTREPRSTGERRGYTGTESYCAPELKERGPDGSLLNEYDEHSDMYSIGVVLFAMCYRTLPSGSYPVELPWRRAAELQTLIVALLARDPEDRPSTDAILQFPLLAGQSYGFPAYRPFYSSPRGPSASPTARPRGSGPIPLGPSVPPLP